MLLYIRQHVPPVFPHSYLTSHLSFLREKVRLSRSLSRSCFAFGDPMQAQLAPSSTVITVVVPQASKLIRTRCASNENGASVLNVVLSTEKRILLSQGRPSNIISE